MYSTPGGGGDFVTPYNPGAPQQTFGSTSPAQDQQQEQNYADTAANNYMQFTVNPNVSGVTSGFGGRGIGNSSFAGSFAAAAQADGAAQASQIGNNAANAWASSNANNVNSSLAPGYLSNSQQQTTNQGIANQNQFNLGMANVGLGQQQITNQAGQFGSTLGAKYFNSIFGSPGGQQF
jgi:hypothetical protein